MITLTMDRKIEPTHIEAILHFEVGEIVHWKAERVTMEKCKTCGEGAANIKVEYHDAKILWPITSDLASLFTIENAISMRIETPYLHCRCKSCGHQFDTQPLYDGF